MILGFLLICDFCPLSSVLCPLSAFQRVAFSAFRNRPVVLACSTEREHHDAMSAATIEIGSLITRTAGIKGGTPHIAGTGVTVRTVSRWHRSGLMPEEIANRIGHLSLAQVHAALAFYYANQEAMDSEMAEEEAESDKIEREHLARQRAATGR